MVRRNGTVRSEVWRLKILEDVRQLLEISPCNLCRLTGGHDLRVIL